MSGSAMMQGGAYQAGVVAWLYVHVLREQRLCWFDLLDDRPVSVAGEVNGPGDDARVDFSPEIDSVEVQAKHGVNGVDRLREVLDRIRDKDVVGQRTVVLAVDRTSAGWVHKVLPTDLDRLRCGRDDAIRKETRRLLERLDEGEREVLGRLHVKVLDVDLPDGAEAKWAITALHEMLEDPQKAEIAWEVLVQDATTLCKKRLTRARSELRSGLEARGLKIRPPLPMEKLGHGLDASKALLRRHKPVAALAVLSDLERGFETDPPDADRKYRFYQQRSAAHLQLGRYPEALEGAKKALTYKAHGLHALLVGGAAAISQGKPEEAQGYAIRAEQYHPLAAETWVLKAEVARETNAEIVPPREVADSTEYRLGMCRIALAENRTAEVVERTGALLLDNEQSAEVRVLRAIALATNDDGDLGVFDPEVAEEVHKLATEAIDDELDDYTLRRAYVARAVAARSLGRQDDCDADMRRSYDLKPDDPLQIAHAAQTHLSAGRLESACQILATRVADEYPLLVALRAAAWARLGRSELAEEEIDRALEDLGKAHDPDAVRLACGDAALSLDNRDLVERSVMGLSKAGLASTRYRMLRGRMAFAEKDIESGRKWMEGAAREDEKTSSGILAELGCRLLAAGQASDAVESFQRAKDIPKKAFPEYVKALIFARKVPEASEIVDGLMRRGQVPDWVLETAVRIAILREDVEGSIGHLSTLTERAVVTEEGRLELLRLLVRLRRHEDANCLVEQLLVDVDVLSPRQRMSLAQAVHLMGETYTAVRLGFDAYRRDSDDPDLQRALAELALQSSELPAVEELGPDCFVRLRRAENDNVLEYTIFEDPPVYAKDGQILVDTAKELGLIGKRVGEVVNVGPALGEGVWRIEEIKPAVQHVVQDILENYGRRFPTKELFVSGFSVRKDGVIADFTPIIENLRQRERHREEVLKVYGEHCLPLGYVANATGESIDHVMRYLSSTEAPPFWYAEWADAAGWQQSLTAVAKAGRVVVTETALWTAQRQQLLDDLKDRFDVVVPQAVLDSVRDRLDELEKSVREGHCVVKNVGDALKVEELGPEDPRLVAQRDDARDRMKWLETYARVMPRPLGAWTKEVMGESAANAIGRSAVGCVELAVHEDATMYCDDLGLRRVAASAGGTSFSTIALVTGLKEAGRIGEEDAAKRALWLAEHRYRAIPVNAGLMCQAFRSLRGDPLVSILALAGPPSMKLDEVARMGARVLRWLTTDIAGLSLGLGTQVLLAAMSQHWRSDLAATALRRAAEGEFSLLPLQLRTVFQQCKRWGA